MKKGGFIKIGPAIGLITALILGLMLAGCDTASLSTTPAPEANQPAFKIGLTQSATHPAADAGRQGFKDALKDAGFSEGKNVTYDYQNPESDNAKGAIIARKFVDEKVDIIFSFGTSVSQATVEAARGTKIAVLFCSVTDPVSAGLIKDYRHVNENVSGTSDMIEAGNRLDLIKKMVPGLKNLGTLYNPAEQNSVMLNDNLRAAAAARGINLVEKKIASGADVQMAAQALIVQVDAVWIGTDNTVVSGLRALIKVTQDNRIPFFPSDDASVQAGGIACLGFDEYDSGYQTGQMAVKILKGTPAWQIPAEKCQTFNYSINTRSAEIYGVTIPPEILDQASKVY